MNYPIVIYIAGWVLRFEGYFLVLPLLVSIIYHDNGFTAFLSTIVLCLLLGHVATFKKPKSTNLSIRDGFVSVALGWILMSVFGALPFVMTGAIPSFTDALFETISGFTTTGASILSDVESLSHSLLFWRSFTHWIGGMGVFVFIMAIMPLLGGATMNLMKAESPGPSVEKLVPHIKDTAKILYGIYLVLTVLEITLLVIFGMPLFDSLCTSFGTVGTGGFGIRNTSMTDYSHALQNIVTIFMMLSGVNYIAYFYIVSKRWKRVFHVEEVRYYFLIIFAAIAIICFDTHSLYTSFGDTLRNASFQVGSIITTTGFATCDFDLWPQFSKTILITLMFIGACAGSTGGGIKVSRIIILFKTIKNEISLMLHPRAVKRIRMDGQCVSDDVVRSTNVFVAVYCVILFASLLLIGIDEKDFTTNFTAVAATLNNIGPGMSLVGPTQNFSFFSPFSKYVLMFDMLAGRLELFPMLMFFAPHSWRKK